MNTIAMQEKPFYALTVELLDCVRDHEYGRLSEICDDDFGIVDITMTGGSLVIRDRTAWEEWFTGLFAQPDSLSARTWSDHHRLRCRPNRRHGLQRRGVRSDTHH